MFRGWARGLYLVPMVLALGQRAEADFMHVVPPTHPAAAPAQSVAPVGRQVDITSFPGNSTQTGPISTARENAFVSENPANPSVIAGPSELHETVIVFPRQAGGISPRVRPILLNTSATPAVPEPASLSLAVVLSGALLCRRRH